VVDSHRGSRGGTVAQCGGFALAEIVLGPLGGSSEAYLDLVVKDARGPVSGIQQRAA
jgi:hypothetical protein